jgi:cobalt-zinc-cadmium efflux system protein
MGHHEHGHGHEHEHEHEELEIADVRLAHHHTHARSLDRRRLIGALVLTTVILVAEVLGGVLSRSLALLSDAGHVLTDLSAQLLSLLALVFASRPADARRTYGYYRLEILAALANGVFLIGLSAVLIYEAIGRFASPEPVKAGLMLAVAAGGLVANLVAAYLLHGAHTLNVRGAYLHVLSDTLASVAVVVGGLIMAWRRGLYLLDPILSLGIAVVVIISAVRLLREATEVLLEAVPAGVDLEQVREEVLACGGVLDVHDLHVWTISSGMHALSAHVVVKDSHAEGSDAVLTQVKEALLRRYSIAHSTIQIESEDYEHVGHVH